jgi:hypothetical protein
MARRSVGEGRSTRGGPPGTSGRPAPVARLSVPVGHGDLGQSLLYVFPLFLLYGVGLLFTPTVNGVDFVSRLLFAAVGHDRDSYLLAHLVLAVGFLGLVLYLRRTSSFRLRAALPMVLEAAIYALTLGSLILLVMDRLLAPVLALAPLEVPVFDLPELGRDIVLAAGAGVHEELIFRLGMLSGGAFVLERLGLRRGAAVLLAAAVSSLLFSAAHHIGPLGDPFRRDVFVYRALAGAAFAAIYWFRSLGHAVYAHFLYDVYVLVLR